MLIEDGKIEDKGSIKANYDAYLHPDLIEYNDWRMWNALDKNEIVDAFQFDSPMGKQVIARTQPRSMLELSTANTLMRLMMQEGATEAPMDTYRKYKDNINLWYDEMKNNGLNQEEIATLEPHLKPLFGVADTQESIMEMSMDKKISGFDVVLAHKLRKAVAKRKPKLVEEIREKFFRMGKENGASDAILDYVWGVQIRRQLGYSFSKNHCMPYTGICIQCMNIVLKHTPIYWNTACLCVNSGSTSEDVSSGKSTDYGRVAKAIGDMQGQGIKIALPDINKARFGFAPDSDNNSIVFGLKAIQGIGDDIGAAIVDKRSYSSMKDFYEKMQQYKAASPENKFGDTAMISLIKAGCFDDLEGKNRVDIMKEFIQMISDPLTSLKVGNIEDLKKLGLLTDAQKKYELRLFKYRKFLFNASNLVEQRGKSPATAFYRVPLEYGAKEFFEKYFKEQCKEVSEYYEDPVTGSYIVKRGAIDKAFDRLLSDFKENTLNNPECLEAVNKQRYKLVWEEKLGTTVSSHLVSKWEMDSMCIYYHEHELSGIDFKKHQVVNFSELSEDPQITDNYYWKGQKKPRYVISRIAGTVIDKNKTRHTVTLLTPSGVVDVKFYAGQFSFYDRQISQVNPDGSKTVLEKSWFQRGTKLLIAGFRRGDQFVPKVYKDSIYTHSVQYIADVSPDGQLTLINDRIEVDADELAE